MKRPAIRRVSRYSKETPRRTFRYHSLRRLAKSDVVEEQRELERGHLITHAHPHRD